MHFLGIMAQAVTLSHPAKQHYVIKKGFQTIDRHSDGHPSPYQETVPSMTLVLAA
jgi:hypothetical protein